MFKRLSIFIAAMVCSFMASNLYAWDHPGHMTTAAIAFSEIEQQRPDLIEKIGLLMMKHPDPAPFWVAAGDAKGKERFRRMFIEGSRWPDDSKGTKNDILSWHSARWAVIEEDATPEAKAAIAARGGKPVGEAIEALELHFGTLANPESAPSERAWSLSWILHILGDIHQPLHVSDFFSKDYPAGNAAGTMSYVGDPLGTTIPLHMLWDSNYLRTPNLELIDKHAQEFVKKYPRTTYPELQDHPVSTPGCFEVWARESHKVAQDWAFAVETIPDPNRGESTEKKVANMIKFVLEGISPVEEAPPLPPEYWEKMQRTAERRLTLAGYRIADLLISAAEKIDTQRRMYVP